MSLSTPLRALPRVAGPSRTTILPAFRSFRGYASRPNRPTRATPPPKEELPNFTELFSRKAIAEAWRGLSTAKRLVFGVIVLGLGYGEYRFMKKVMFDPLKARKEAEEEKERLALLGGTAGKEGGVVPVESKSAPKSTTYL
ncbi:hypothetical protein IAT38_002882 [Cryptococcus sp. DSM 104549]